MSDSDLMSIEFSEYWVQLENATCYIEIPDNSLDPRNSQLQVTGRVIKVPLKNNRCDLPRLENALDAHLEEYLFIDNRDTSIFRSQSYLNVDVSGASEIRADVCFLLFVALGKNMYFLVLNSASINLDAEEERECYQRVGCFELDKDILDVGRYLRQFKTAKITLT